MNARNDKGVTLQEIDIKRVYGDTISFSSLINYYHETGAHDEVVKLFAEVPDDASKNWKLKENPFLYFNILDSINKSEKKKKPEKLLCALFEKLLFIQLFRIMRKYRFDAW